MNYVTVEYNGKPVYSGHPLAYPEKAQVLQGLLEKYDWCFLPIPVVDLGTYYQALDGTHRLEAARSAGLRPEIVVIDARLHPDQPLPEGWWQILDAPLTAGRTIRGFETRSSPVHRNHIGVVLDASREILRVEYVEALFNILLRLAFQAPLIHEKPVDSKVVEYLAKAVRFSECGEMYQSLPDGSVEATRDMEARWKAYGITPADLKGKIILDVGCNVGGFSAFCTNYCESYCGVDIDPDSIALARHLYNYPNCFFEVRSIVSVPRESYDVIFAFAVWYYTGLSLEAYATKMALLLRPEGVLYYESHGNDKVEDQRGAFERFFDIVRVVSVPTVSNGRRSDSRFFAEMRKR